MQIRPRRITSLQYSAAVGVTVQTAGRGRGRGDVGCRVLFLAAFVAVWGCGRPGNPDSGSIQPATTSAPSTRTVAPPAATHSQLTVYQLTMAPGDLAGLASGDFSNTEYPVTFTTAGKVYKDVKIRVRGQWSRGWPKKSLKLHFSEEQPFEARHSLNLNSGWRDPAFAREVLAYHIYQASGAPASLARFVKLEVNGKFHGLFLDIEQPSKKFLESSGLKGATLFKATGRANQADERQLGAAQNYAINYLQETHRDEGYGVLETFCQDLAHASQAVDFFEKNVDVDRYVNFLAATVLTQNWDTYNKNHFLAYDGRGSKKWVVLPWDLDRTLGDHWNGSFDEARLPVLLGTQQQPGVTGWNRLEDRFLREPRYRARLARRLNQLLESEFTPGKLFPYLDQLEGEISAAAAADRARWGGGGDLHQGIAQLKDFIQQRRAFLQAEVRKLK